MLAAILTLTLSLTVIAGGFYTGARLWRIHRWPTTVASVVHREVGMTKTPGSDDPRFRYEPFVRYRFEVDGKAFEADGIWLSHRPRLEEQARAMLDAIPQDPVVHYNPADPGEAYLYVDSYGWALGMVLLGLIGTIAGLALLYRARHGTGG